MRAPAPLLLLAALLAAPALAGGIDRGGPILPVAVVDDGAGAVIAVDAAGTAGLAAFRPRQTAYGLTFSLPDAAFSPGQATLRPGTAVDALAAYVLADPAIRLRIAGHADRPTPAAAAQAQRRAQTVAAAIAAAGVAVDRIEALGEAADHPVAEGTTPAARARNRRVEITLLGAEAAPQVAMR